MASNLPPKNLFADESGQALTEYVLVLALIALSLAAVLGLWKYPLAKYLERIATAIARPR